MKRWILGYIREGDAFVELRSDVRRFLDATRESACIAKIVPLAFAPVESWTTTDDALLLPHDLRDLLRSNRMLVTAPRPTTPYFVLMYPRADNAETSRGGVLLRGEGASFRPVVVRADGAPYLVELKGCGCPLGGYGAYHLRRTSPTGCHFHVAGALSLAGAHAELSGLEALRAGAHRYGGRRELRAVACARYASEAARRGEVFGQVIRLAPSSLRASFHGHPVLDELLRVDDGAVMRNLGREAAALLDCDDPRIHRNPSLNNLCFVSPGTFVLSDIEAAPPISSGYEAIDFEDSVIPDRHRHAERSERCFDDVVAGLRGAPGDVGRAVASAAPRDSRALDEAVFRAVVAPRILRLRIEGRADMRATLGKNFDHLRVFMPAPFFEVSWSSWLAEHFVPLFEDKRAIVACYGAGDEDALRRRLATHATGAHKRLEAACAVGAYVPDRQLETLYVERPVDEEARRRNARCVASALSLAHSFLAGDVPALPAGGDAPWGPADVVLPFLGFTRRYLANELRWLDALECEALAERSIVERARAEARALACALEARPHALHDVIRQGREAFVDHLVLSFGRAAP